MIFNMSGGGLNAHLNFRIVGSPEQPSDPTENLIWIQTDVKIPEWFFSEYDDDPTIRDSEDLYIEKGEKTGTYLNSYGAEITSAEGYVVSPHIPLPDGTLSLKCYYGYATSYTGEEVPYHVFYDKNREIVQLVRSHPFSREYPIPADAVSVRLTTFPNNRSIKVYYQATEEGTVWIDNRRDDLSEQKKFNLLKHKGYQVYVYPKYAWQFVSGEWKDVNAQIFQGGTWIKIGEG